MTEQDVLEGLGHGFHEHAALAAVHEAVHGA